MTPEDFVRNILKDRLRASEVHEGYNFRFGCKASGDVAMLKKFGTSLGFEVVLYPEMRVSKEPVSSTHIRHLLENGEVGRASPPFWDARLAFKLRPLTAAATDLNTPFRR